MTMQDGSSSLGYSEGKIMIFFECCNETCRKRWTSLVTQESIVCPHCNGVAEIDKFLDELYELKNYCCPNESCDKYGWQSVHNQNQEECKRCGSLIQPEGTLKKHRRHTFMTCTNPSCKKEWEEFDESMDRTQRCYKCLSRGNVVKTSKKNY